MLLTSYIDLAQDFVRSYFNKNTVRFSKILLKSWKDLVKNLTQKYCESYKDLAQDFVTSYFNKNTGTIFQNLIKIQERPYKESYQDIL